MTSEQASIVVMYAKDSRSVVVDLLRRGWAGNNTKPPAEILQAMCNRSDLVVGVYGEFDDPDVAVAAIGKKEMIVNLCS